MSMGVKRVFVEKKNGFDIEGKELMREIIDNLRITLLTEVRVLNRYDIEGIEDEDYLMALGTIFSEPTLDLLYEEEITFPDSARVFAIEYLPGQFDQRADSAAQCIQILSGNERPDIHTAKVIILSGNISNGEFERIKGYCINSVDSREAFLEKPDKLQMDIENPSDVKILEGFINMTDKELIEFMNQNGFAMNYEDLKFCQEYFKNTEKRNPSITEIKVIDTYWSDHCRHTTFETKIEDVQIEKGVYSKPIEEAYREYVNSREFVYGNNSRDMCLMDIAVIGMKELRKKSLLNDLEVSGEINACSIEVDVDVDGKQEKWLVMFKNETHNHPTEIEPYGGAATCLGGAIRDPLSGRAYVYQAMRVTGSGDPRTKIEDTPHGKLPQIKITTGAAKGYSSYGNQIGLATGQVHEVYDQGFVAKRMEIGAVIAAAPRENVIREIPSPGDVIILVGGRTGRDGCGGATGSSKEHTEESIITCGAEVQKGNPPTERKIQRLFRNPKAAKLIKRCNDFGAGGISVAVGELTEGIEINLDFVPKKYEGLDGTELAISESQERMAVVVSKEDADKFIAFALEENLEATAVANVTSDNRLRMKWRGNTIVDISRDFLSTNGIKQEINVKVGAPTENSYFKINSIDGKNIKDEWLKNLEDINNCSQRGLIERFDSTIGAGSVLQPYGGKYETTPAEGMAAKLPVLTGNTNTSTTMTFGYEPKLAKWSPFHGGVYSIVEAVGKTVAMGGNFRKTRLTLQEYFEKLGEDPKRWGKPFSALLGALYAQKMLQIPAIGGKDSMSGTFKEIDVPPTLVAFAVSTSRADKIISPEFKRVGSSILFIPVKRNSADMPDFDMLSRSYDKICSLIQEGKVLAAATVKGGGIAEVLSTMCFGNKIGAEISFEEERLFTPELGSLILEMPEKIQIENEFSGIKYEVIGKTQEKPLININEITIKLDEAQRSWEMPLEKVFPSRILVENSKVQCIDYSIRNKLRPSIKFSKPRVVIPVFPGTNCEYDTARAFERAGAETKIIVFKNLSSSNIVDSIKSMTEEINKSQIIALPGGFSAGDEPDGSGKFIAAIFRNQYVKEAVMKLLNSRDGLILGICNGFQALIKLGLVPYGEIRDMDEDWPTLTYNKIGRHMSGMVRTRVSSALSPWLQGVEVGDVHTIPISHGEGRFAASQELVNKLLINGQIATQYIDSFGNAAMQMPYNPNGSDYAIEGITSPDGRVFGKMGHSERIGENIAKNICGNKNQKIFEAGVKYFR
ncbi:MAG: phosphoribosylformylglycinamidine synthase [Clostridiales bacterium]|nr:phosphoribosylformylglycinamidine synthase [Clostridiales bacterium]